MTTQEKLLARLIRRIDGHQDTPDLIMIIAAHASYLWACRTIVDPTAGSAKMSPSTVKRICAQYGWRHSELRKKLMPAATALGIISAPQAPDLYQQLGVPQGATVHEIKQASRNQAFTLHPDTAADPPENDESLRGLLEAYRTLRDPVQRRFYDANRRRRWREYPARLLHDDIRAFIYRWYLSGLGLIFIILLLLTIIIF